MNKINKLHFNLSQEIYLGGKISHNDEINSFYHYEIQSEDDKEIIYACTEVKEAKGNNLNQNSRDSLKSDRFTLKVNKSKNDISISRHGIVKSEMFFSVNKKTDFFHESEHGKIGFTMCTTSININDDYIEIIYDLLNKEELLSKNIVKINFKN